MYVNSHGTEPVIICDIDGTIANIEHRLHFIKESPKDFDSFYASVRYDSPIAETVELVETLACHHRVIFVSGRPNRTREQTEYWLANNVPYAFSNCGVSCGDLYMRKDGDYRQDYIVKEELLAQIRKDGYEPWIAIDDRTQVVQMWRKNGIRTLQCADGDY